MPRVVNLFVRSRRPAPSGRFGRALRWLRWPALALWVLAIVILHPLAGSLYQVTDDTAAANLPASAPSTQVAAIEDAAQQDSGQQRRSDDVTVVVVRTGGLTSTDLSAVRKARAAVAGLVGNIGGLTEPGPVRRSPDGRAGVFTAQVMAPTLHETTMDTSAVQSIRRAVARATSNAHPGLQTAVTGQAAVTADGGSTSQATLLATALIIVAIVLLFVYRSVLLWVFPLLGALGGIVVAQAAAHGLGSAGLTVSSLSTSILIVLSFGAASDYAVLLIHRYRAELRRDVAVEDAMAAALKRTFPTLAASAGTVVGAMLCLLAAQSASLHGLGPVGAVAIVSALLAQTTFLPALLLVFGRFAFWPRPPRVGQDGNEASRIWSGVGTRVARHPARVALAAIVLMGGCCAGLLGLHIDNNPLTNLKGNPDSVVGARLVTEHYGPGVVGPLDVLVPGQSEVAQAVARSTPDVAGVAPMAALGDYTRFSVTLSVDPYSNAGGAVIRDLRTRLHRVAPGSLVGGGPAIQYDVTQASGRDAAVLIPIVLVVVFIVVAVLLQALLAPLLLVATTALSFAASFGLSNLLWRDIFGFAGIKADLPLYIFVFLVALGVDYNIFLVARIREEARRTGTRHATLRGLAVTGGVITAAGIILAGTFAALAQQPVVDLTEVGTAIAIGVLLDTLLVRTVLVPAAFLLTAKHVWWPVRFADRTSNGEPRGGLSQDAASSPGTMRIKCP